MAAGAGDAALSCLPRQGAAPDTDGTGFRVWSSCAERVELCLYDSQGHETRRIDLEAEGGGDWFRYCPGVQTGQMYGYRVHGAWAPDRGLRANPAKLLLDPYARQISGKFHWSAAVFDFDPDQPGSGWRASELDSAAFVPRSVVCEVPPSVQRRDMRRWAEAVVYETNVRGFTMQHPELSQAERGRFAGLSNAKIVAYLKALGINTVELQPVQSWIDEHHLAHRGLRNFWGYNSIGFFAPDQRLAGPNPIDEFRAMLACLHEAGFDVILDVVFNHTGEGDALGPTLCFRGLDNLAYYRVEPDDPGVHINDTGTGNTINADHPRVQALVLDSLAYWHQRMGVDGFRFDLAPILGRFADGFSPDHPLLAAISAAPELAGAQLIAEPWDPGPGGYQLGSFPASWSEWNDRYRDTVRQFWRGDNIGFDELARRVDGSEDIFARPDRSVSNSINFVTAHDGFTLADLVSYEQRHNEANGEENRDGHQHNYSVNHGVEGPTDSRVIVAQRRRHRLNLYGTLLLSQGIPMLLAGDELGHSQQGNNNAYAQDNELGWLDWSLLNEDPEFLASIRQLIALRSEHALLCGGAAADGSDQQNQGPDIRWYSPQGQPLNRKGADTGWTQRRAGLQLLSHPNDATSKDLAAVYINGHDFEVEFQLPLKESWTCAWSSAARHEGQIGKSMQVAAWSIGLFIAS